MKKMIKLIALALVLTLSVVMLASCNAPNSNPEKAVAALEKNGYTAGHDESSISALFAGIDPKDVTDVVIAYKRVGINIDSITIIYFEDTNAAKDAWEEIKKEIEDEIDEDSGYVVEKSGKMIWFGTEDAVKAAK